MDRTLILAEKEAARYGVEAQFRIEEALPSFEIRSSDGKIVIAAPDSLEILYGVYEFAERFNGWCFFSPGRDEFLPERKKEFPAEGVLLPAKKPLLHRRGFIQEFPFNEETPALFDWMAKNKLNYLLTWMKYYDDLSPELKQAALDRGIAIESGHHNFDYWIPGKVYGKTNPEFFAEINGKRINPSGKSELLLSEQLCTTNPELRKEFVRRMDEYCQAHPEIKTISLVPNDGFGWCECENCAKFYDKNKKGDFYSLSTHVYKADVIYHDLVRDVSAQLRALGRDVTLTFCAYVNYCAPSPGMTLEKGMAIHIAPYWRCINHPLDDPSCETNASYLEDIRKWCSVKKGGQVNIYEYYMGVNFYLSLPMIHWEEMFREMECYNRIGVDGVLTQFHIPHWTAYGTNYRMMALAARGEDCRESICRMLEELFGPDAAEAGEFYRSIRQAMLRMGKCHIPYPRSILRRMALSDFESFHEKALALCAKAPENVLRKELVIWTEYMIRFKKLFDLLLEQKAAEKDVDDFVTWIHTHRNTRVFVHEKFDTYFQAVKTAIRQGSKWVHFNLDWEDAYILKHDETLQ